jgi:hypothetical protein
MRTALLWVTTQRVVVISYRDVKNVGPIGFSETSVKNYRYSLRKKPEEHVYQEIYDFYVT